MKTANSSGKENAKDEQEAWKGNKTLIMNSATLKGKSDEKEEEVKAMPMWDCGSPLYDSYELVSLDHLIDRNLMAFPSLHGSNPTISHHSHDEMVPTEMAKKVGSPEKSKETFKVTSLRQLFVKMRKRKNNDERRKKNKEMRRGIVESLIGLLCCGGNKKIT